MRPQVAFFEYPYRRPATFRLVHGHTMVGAAIAEEIDGVGRTLFHALGEPPPPGVERAGVGDRVRPRVEELVTGVEVHFGDRAP